MESAETHRAKEERGKRVAMSKVSCIVRMITMIVVMVMVTVTKAASMNYAEALGKSILFFEGQRSGKLPPSQRMKWRKDSALSDGSDIQVNKLSMDLVGGYYDAGDNVKFNFPMAFTTTMLAWSVVEFGDSMGSELKNALDAIRWGTDYFIKATKFPDKVVAVVGDPVKDHNCWERPEDMDTPRTSYYVTQNKPGSEVSAEIAAALAASSIAFRSTDASYSNFLLNRAIQVFDFANKYRGSYNLSVGEGACPFYCDYSGYVDELIWGAAWLYKATETTSYWDFVKANIQSIDNNNFEFGWDCKNAGINVLVSQKIPCGQEVADPTLLINIAKSQADYILGKNPLGMSYMVGYGDKFPEKIHHRGSVVPSLDAHPQHLGCRDGDEYFKSDKTNLNVLIGAVVGGPAEDDSFQDSRLNVAQSEPTTYINAPFVGVLAYFNKPTVTVS
ncbi:unnamed protein product [Sphenostylis stenocarpa]|uniref:Endoglucanase n=1 Tax=Sphenostylis stenocarpa TaxID=92480 RepID=A0AA86VAU9_9FABA|nr:unnamed protein product [Sphenostylis stenocarpa]